MKKVITSLSSALLIFVASLSFTGVAKSAEFFTIGTGGPTGVYFQTGNAICKMLHKSAIAKEHGRKKGIDKAYRCTAPSTGGSNYNIGQIAAGEFQFGVAQSDWQYHAVNGSSKWEGKQYSDLRAVFSVHNEPFQIWARKKAKVKDFAGLEGKVVNIGNAGSGQRGTMEVLMDAKGVHSVTPQLRPEDASMPLGAWMDPDNFNPNYLMRSQHLMPKSGDKQEWKHDQNYSLEKDVLPAVDLEDGCLVFE